MKNNNDSLGARMKMYEQQSRSFLKRKTPVIVRLDGCHFHTVSRGFDKPFDVAIERAMKHTMLFLCSHIQGCVLGYTQSDEITLVLCDYQKVDTAAWYEYNIQKITSVSASMASFAFIEALKQECLNLSCLFLSNEDASRRSKLLAEKIEQGAFFDSRAFNLPTKEEVVNNLIWREQDAIRNSIQGLAQSLFSHNEIQCIKNKDILEKMKEEKGIEWSTYLTGYQQRGCCAIKVESEGEYNGTPVKRTSWEIDDNIPLFTQDRDYILSRITFESDKK